VSPRTGRRAGDNETRELILGAARARFGRSGYEGATIRGIAADAGVDPALVHHFYGTKERLFVAAMHFPVVPSDALHDLAAVKRSRLGEAIVRLFLEIWDEPDARSTMIGLLRSAANNEDAARMLRQFVSGAILGQLKDAVAAPDVDLRVSLVASQVVGLAFTRFVVKLEPIASASRDEIGAAIGPTIQRYLTGNISGGVRNRR
jgi:AcrR family transcriptional regulator